MTFFKATNQCTLVIINHIICYTIYDPRPVRENHHLVGYHNTKCKAKI